MFAALAAPVSFNPAAAPHRVHPNATSWRHTCATVRRMRSSKRRVNLRRASPPWVEMLTAPGSSSAQAALVRAAAQLERDLADRNVLCSKIVGEACVVTTFNTTGVLTICLPPSARVRASRMCEPWGEAFQQHGGAIGNFTMTACVSFDTFKISRWWKAMRAATPFLTSTADPRLAALLKAKHFASRFQKTQRDPASVAARVAHFGRLLNLSLHRSHDAAASLVNGAAGAATTAAARAVAAASDAGPWQPRMFERCAVVGSGHDIRCSPVQHGHDIDSADAVFRSNAAQPSRPSHPNVFYAHDDRNVPRYVRLFMRLNRIESARAGTRTSFRTNCLLGARAVSTEEVCVIPRDWWSHGWDREMKENNRHPCCDVRRHP
jgi:hypothetical protein